MTLTLRATAGAPDANAYATVEEADASLGYRVGAAAWASLTADQKVQALVTATRDLDTLSFIGTRATATQALEWPRVGTPYPADAIPAKLVQATIEHAFSLVPAITGAVEGDPLAPVPSNVKERTVDVITTVYFEPKPVGATTLERFSAPVQRLLTDLVRTVVTKAWGSSTAVRTS